ncbi:helix-turn-helix transcriptional regulator [Nocardia fluminea]|uniref:Excisionase family DNA binding protein n=1 Tax=Nocardia fluminea TaxID=134984 RepID=A0A2N3V4L0_9NOCA|nr:helix-turn-helix domain-containing protein [Nocardia fluminea]PKV76554.1 excisionase family DNA binding protein [Nocardia fluminea]
MSAKPALSIPELTSPTTDMATAAAVLGIGRSTAYSLAAAGDFPCKVIRIGTRYRVVTADLHRLLAIA